MDSTAWAKVTELTTRVEAEHPSKELGEGQGEVRENKSMR